MRTEPPWTEIDTGIVDAVRLLWDAGFTPTDSGDGSKAKWMEDALSMPHVFCVMDPANLVAETDRAGALSWEGLGMGAPHIEASYAPGSVAVLAVFFEGARR